MVSTTTASCVLSFPILTHSTLSYCISELLNPSSSPFLLPNACFVFAITSSLSNKLALLLF